MGLAACAGLMLCISSEGAIKVQTDEPSMHPVGKYSLHRGGKPRCCLLRLLILRGAAEVGRPLQARCDVCPHPVVNESPSNA